MSWRNLIRFLGFLLVLALVVSMPIWVGQVVAAFITKNVVLMVIGVAAVIIIDGYLIYWVIRYLVVQAREKFFT